MTDERARLWAALKALSDEAPVGLADLIDAVAEAADAVRLAERRRLIAYLRSPGVRWARAEWAADRLERGET